MFLHKFAIFFGFIRISFTSRSLDMTGVTPLYDLCPYTNYCSRNATKSLENNDKTPCCGHCSCKDDCWERGNCCVDKQNIIVRQPLESCLEVIVKKGVLHKTQTSLPRYYVIQSCPTLNDTLTEMCVGNNQSSFDDFIWVTDDRTNKIYNNKHCAACHGLVSYTKWQIATDCLVPMNGETSAADAFNFVMNKCALFVIPPENTDEGVNRCFISDFNTCNETRKWRSYDPALESACHSFEQLYYYQENRFQFYIKNVYCFLCNFGTREQEVKDVCESTTSTGSKTDLFGFTAILDFTGIDKEIQIKADGALRPQSVCSSDEIKDPLEGECLKLTCPMLHAPIYGKCEKLISSTSLLGISASFKLDSQRSESVLILETSEFRVENFAETLFKKLQRKLSLVKGNCDLRKEALCGTFENKSIPGMFAIQIRYTTAKGCQEDLINDRILWLLNETINVQLEKKFVSFTATAISSMEYFRYCTSARDKYNVGTWLALKYIDFQSFIGCPSVLLNEGHYANLMGNASEASQREKINHIFNLTALGSNITSQNENFTTQVCFESYSSVLMANQRNALADLNGPNGKYNLQYGWYTRRLLTADKRHTISYSSSK